MAKKILNKDFDVEKSFKGEYAKRARYYKNCYESIEEDLDKENADGVKARTKKEKLDMKVKSSIQELKDKRKKSFNKWWIKLLGVSAGAVVLTTLAFALSQALLGGPFLLVAGAVSVVSLFAFVIVPALKAIATSVRIRRFNKLLNKMDQKDQELMLAKQQKKVDQEIEERKRVIEEKNQKQVTAELVNSSLEKLQQERGNKPLLDTTLEQQPSQKKEEYTLKIVVPKQDGYSATINILPKRENGKDATLEDFAERLNKIDFNDFANRDALQELLNIQDKAVQIVYTDPENPKKQIKSAKIKDFDQFIGMLENVRDKVSDAVSKKAEAEEEQEVQIM